MRLFVYALLAVVLLPGLSSGESLRDRVVENHHAYIPPGRGPFPTVIAIPGCSGISTNDPAIEESNPELHEDDLLFRRHYRAAAQDLEEQGFVVYLIDVHTAEGVLTACAGEIQKERIARYIDEAVAWALEQSAVMKDRIHLIGWSMGGRGVLQWLNGPRKESGNVRSAIAVYPPCGGQEDISTSMPILVLLGGADDIAEPSECEHLIRASSVRERIVVRSYPGARHGFDIVDAPSIVDIGNGMTVGYQKEAAEASWREILAFLSRDEMTPAGVP